MQRFFILLFSPFSPLSREAAESVQSGLLTREDKEERKYVHNKLVKEKL